MKSLVWTGLVSFTTPHLTFSDQRIAVQFDVLKAVIAGKNRVIRSNLVTQQFYSRISSQHRSLVIGC